jgi:D-beta-D-heptose 7-phosphate kinase/D-beta-D-heptose 1-phosphate adenosyltransferase
MYSPETLVAFERAMERLSGVRALVVGDVVLDRYVAGEVQRISPEAPVPVLLQTERRAVLGGAANVARHFTAFGGSAVLVGLIGVDAAAGEIGRLATEAGLTADLVADTARMTTVKTRVLARNQQMMRIDEETPHVAAGDVRARLLAAVESHLGEVDVVVMSDYAKGTLGGGVAATVAALARAAKRPVFADPKTEDFDAYKGATLVCPNVKELAAAVGLRAVDDATAGEACRRALDRFDIEAVLVTRSEQGMTLLQRGAAPLHVRTRAVSVFDVSGAGDTAIAVVAAGVAAGLSLPDAVHFGNAAAGIVVGKSGTATVSPLELKRSLGLTSLHKPMSRSDTRELVAAWRAEGQVIGFTNGVFDLLHSGHIQSLEQAAEHCDILVVGVNSDASVKRLKGPSRPIQDETTRARVLAALDVVDVATIFSEDTPRELIAAIEPDVIFKGQDYREDQVVGADLVKARGGRVVLLPLVEGVSTSSTVERVKRSG